MESNFYVTEFVVTLQYLEKSGKTCTNNGKEHAFNSLKDFHLYNYDHVP